MNDKVFNRIEKKYLITEGQKHSLLKLIRHHMSKDRYHKSEVLNLYFDNDHYDLIAGSIDWVDFKAKIRARSYAGYDRVYMEIKTKLRPEPRRNKHQEYEDIDDNIGYKRRVIITKNDFEELINHHVSLESLAARSVETKHDLQIAKEIDYLIQYHNLSPKILVTYNRLSYKDDQDFRITFDENLKYRNRNLSFKPSKRDKIYFKDDHNIIMEVKTNTAIPLWFAHKLSELQIYPQQFSKIGKTYERIMNV